MATIIAHFFHYFYSGHPWYTGSVWSNVFVIVIVAPLGYLWSKTKFWPLRPIKHISHQIKDRLDELHDKHDASHDRLALMEDSLRRLHKKHDDLTFQHDELHRKINRINKPS